MTDFFTALTPVSADDLFEECASESGAAGVMLCANNRLARNLRLRFAQRQQEQGATLWPTPQALTISVWLGELGEALALSGAAAVAEVPERVLSPFQEVLVWRRLIEQADGGDAMLALFDLNALAQTAAEAHALVSGWRLPLDEASGAEEVRRFAEWRRHFKTSCRKNGWLDGVRYQQLVCAWIERGLGHLPARITFAGFDAPAPLLRRLAAALAARGVLVRRLEFSATASASAIRQVVAAADASAECAAAAAWARTLLENNPDTRIGIVVADLEARRATLAPILDAVLHPAALAVADDAAAQRYNISLGLPLKRHAMVRTALALLRVLGQPHGLMPADFGMILRLPYWSLDLGEADLRARLDAHLRERPGQLMSCVAVQRLIPLFSGEQPGQSSHCGRSERLSHHLQVLGAAQAAAQRLRLPGAWAEFFRQTLVDLGWPGERTLSSAEFQTRAAFFEALDAFATLDAFLGHISIQAAVSEFTRLCGEQIFQPMAVGQPPIQVLGMLEAAGAAFDALWVMGMNDSLWPPPPRPNPLLPAELQRSHGTPGASVDVQAAFARAIHTDLLCAAPHMTLSYAQQEGERALRPSPLLDTADVRQAAPGSALAAVYCATGGGHAALLSEMSEMRSEWLDDHQAPPLAAGEHVSGGSGLFKAQAICPAWAFYRYRLGAKQLNTPVEGLDAAARGTLVHGMLQAFWQAIGTSAQLAALDAAGVHQALARAVDTALTRFETQLGAALMPTFRQLEAARLAALGEQWLRVEWDTERGSGRAPFSVVACEQSQLIELGQLRIQLIVDRIDTLCADGRAVVLDYKTGSGKLSVRRWEEERISEPQLPLYASFVLGQAGQPPLAAVAFAKVRSGECQFAGVAAAAGLLPGVAEPQGAGPQARAANVASDSAEVWQAMLDTWKDKLLRIADEIHRGEAAVRFENESDLAYCEVLPLLRLAERRQQCAT